MDVKNKPAERRARTGRRSSLMGGEIRALLVVGLLGVLGAGAWAVYYAGSRETASASRELAGAVVSSCESLLVGENLSQLRRHIVSIGALPTVQHCSVTLPDGSVIAHSSPSSVELAPVPAEWAGAATLLSERRDPGTDGLVMTRPLMITGRGEGTLEIAFSPSGMSVWDPGLLLGEGAVAGLSLLGVVLVLARARARLRGVQMVRGALLEAGRGVRSRELLSVDERFGAEARAWMGLLTDYESLRASRADESVDAALTSSATGAGPLGEAFDALWQGVLILERNGSVMYANGAASVLLQAKRDAMVGAPMSSMVQDPEALEALNSVLGGGSSGRRVVEIDRSSGNSGDESGGVLRLSLRSLSGEDGGAALALIEDVTQQRVADQARNAFVANATHELRTPLTNIRLYVEEAVDAESDEAVRGKALNVINSEARRLERIVSDMLSVSEIEAGSMALRESDVRTDALFEELERDFEASAQEKGIEMRFELPPKLPVLTGDRDKIAMALHNLVGNAIKYTPAGGDVVVRVEDSDGVFRVEVKDNGIGISDEDCQRVFEKFYRARDKRIKHVTGSGIGLALAREVIRLHGGDIEVESEMDEGSRFTLSLPAPAQAA